MTAFVPGLALAHSCYLELVAPLVDVPHTACLIGEGSEVLGYDDPRSTDHEWGPRLQLFVATEDVASVSARIDNDLGAEHRGYPTRWFSLSTQRIDHHIEVGTLSGWLHQRMPELLIEPSWTRDHPPTDDGRALDNAGWLATPQQHLLQLTSGNVFRDDLGTLTRLRAELGWYPTDVWRWLIATQWQRIGITEPFLGRTMDAGDQRGARLIVSRLCRLIMEMAFLQERRYRPYDKWFGRAFTELEADKTLGPLIDDALAAPPLPSATSALSRALLSLADRHNQLAISEAVKPKIDDFQVMINDAVRPFPVLNTSELINATLQAISDRQLRDLPRIGSIDQLTEADDTMINFSHGPRAMAELYRAMSPA
jgi:hypothetical protein